MSNYGAKEIAASFRTVRKNTVSVAEDIPEDKYDYRPAPGTQSVKELLTHIALGGRFQEQINLIEKRSSMEGFDYFPFRDKIMAEAAQPRSKAAIIALLKDEGEKYATAVESLSDDYLGEVVTMPAGAPVPTRSRFDMLISVKEHEMHHRGQLMLIERLLGIMPHLTRENQARVAAMEARMSATQNAGAQ